MSMSDFCFDITLEDGGPEDTYRKQREDKIEYTDGRNTDFREELEALRRTHQVLPDYVPKPVSATRNEDQELQEYTVEQYDFDSRIEYALEDGFDQNTVESAFAELEEVISVMHHHPDLVPHGELIGNTFIDDGSPVLVNFRGIPQNEAEQQSWEEQDLHQFQWLKENGLRHL